MRARTCFPCSPWFEAEVLYKHVLLQGFVADLACIDISSLPVVPIALD